MTIKKLSRLFVNSVMTFGEKGSGKDMLDGNIIARRNQSAYISNTDYHIKYKQFIPLDLDKLNINNTYSNFISDNLNYYDYPYPDNADIYIQDCGVYFPAQYCNELNRDYKHFIAFLALSRHLGLANVHCNCQALNRIWDKLREMSTTYIQCRGCIVLLGFVFQRVRIYERYDSAVGNVQPFRAPFTLNKDKRNLYDMQKVNYDNTHGSIKSCILIYRNKTKYNTRLFKEKLLGGTLN